MILRTVTTDELIAADLKLPLGKSLIQMGRAENYRHEPFTDAQNHVDLGSETLKIHGKHRQYALDGPSFEETDEPLPERNADNHLGGDGHTFLMPVWEEPVN